MKYRPYSNNLDTNSRLLSIEQDIQNIYNEITELKKLIMINYKRVNQINTSHKNSSQPIQPPKK